MVYITDQFELSMLPDLPCYCKVRRVKDEDVKQVLPDAVSAVGRVQSAAFFSEVLGQEVQCQRKRPWLLVGDRIMVGEYRGPWVPEGIMELPEDASIHWRCVEVC